MLCSQRPMGVALPGVGVMLCFCAVAGAATGGVGDTEDRWTRFLHDVDASQTFYASDAAVVGSSLFVAGVRVAPGGTDGFLDRLSTATGESLQPTAYLDGSP